MRKRHAYDVKFKLEAIELAEKLSNRQAARKFEVDESMVRRWRKNKAQLVEVFQQQGPTKKKKVGSGRKPCLSTIEDELMDRIVSEQEQQHVSSKMISAWAKEMADENGITDFNASKGWLFNFLKRYNLTMKRRTATGQLVQNDEIDEEMPSFIQFNSVKQEVQ